jgi:isopenicillin-N epimerase
MNSHRSYWHLDPRITFLNHGSFGACPTSVLAEQARLREQMENEPLRFLWREIDTKIDAAREDLADFLHADPEELVFVNNATAGVNAVVRSLDLQPGDELLTTNHAYNACHNVLAECARRSGARVVVAHVPFPIEDPEQVVQAVLGAVTKRTRLALVDHVTSPTAVIFPIVDLVVELESRGVDVLVDGAHAPGMVPLDLRALRPAYYTGNLHKWVCAPKGAGFLHVRRDRQAGIQPPIISHGYNTPRPGRSRFHDAFDWQGTLDITAWLAVPAAIRFCEMLIPGGWPALMDSNHSLANAARSMLCERLGVKPPCPEFMLGSMATLPLPEIFQRDVGGESRAVIERFDPLQTQLFEEHGIEVPLIKFGDPVRRWFRVSAQAYNSASDYLKLANALQAEVRVAALAAQ